MSYKIKMCRMSFLLVISVVFVLALSSCASNEPVEYTVKCQNGKFIGITEDNGVIAFKNISYMPENNDSSATRANDVHEVTELNIWAANLSTFGKSVVVFFHGGDYTIEGDENPLYDGKYFANAYPDILFVTVNYHTNITNFTDLKNTSDTEDAAMLDQREALRWIKQNIKKFGGSPKKVTVCGHSAGANYVARHLASNDSEGLFRRAILMSGAITSKDIFDKIADGASKDADVLIGTVGDEMNYWAKLMCSMKNTYPPVYVYDEAEIHLVDSYNNWLNEKIDLLYDANFGLKRIFDQYMRMAKNLPEDYTDIYPDIWRKTSLLTQLYFRLGSIKFAEAHSDAGGKGKTYMYVFNKTENHADMTWMRAAHSCELPYVFNNVVKMEKIPSDTILAKNFSEALANFVRTGNPSTLSAHWADFNATTRNTMIIHDDTTLMQEKDPDKYERELLQSAFGQIQWNDIDFSISKTDAR